MTDTSGGNDPPAPSPGVDVSANIKAEIVRARTTAADVRARLAERYNVVISPTAWTRRMHDAGDWRYRELAVIADLLGITVASLVIGRSRGEDGT